MSWIDEVCDPEFASKVVIEQDSDQDHQKRLQAEIDDVCNCWDLQCFQLSSALRHFASSRCPTHNVVQRNARMQLGALLYDTLQQ